MKDLDVHIGLSEKEIRDFFQESIVSIYSNEIELGNKFKVDKETIYGSFLDKNDFGYIRRTISLNELEIVYMREQLKFNQSRLGLFLLMKDKGWCEFDMSEYVGASGNYFRAFIGTESEFEKFIQKFQ